MCEQTPGFLINQRSDQDRPEETDIIIVIQIDLEHRDFVEAGQGVIVDPFDQVLTSSVIDGVSHRTRRVQGSKSAAKKKRSN